ncbi:MAG: DUF5606 domain-containing protein [Flammeovirgaceae bacterium]|nr:DUF5606 domain-containing protein [Flammeovirgaceae bacterium]MDW8286877.1 DUF5606 domain-containing protein [Flammeovirgaceae bacterium]
MNLKDIVAVSGKSGLFKIIKPTRTGLIVESLDDKKEKLIIANTNKISILKEISVYVNTAEDAILLRDVFLNIYHKYRYDVDVDTNVNVELTSFMADILPNYDRSRVYLSDIKKIINWYKLIVKYAPEVLQEEILEKENAEKVKETTK